VKTSFDLGELGGEAVFRELVSEVVAAGEDALTQFRSGAANAVQLKPDRSPVTAADQHVEARLRAFVDRRFPNADFLGEETGGGNRTTPLRFVVDPIDGTRAFIRGLPTWSVLVGVEHHGDPVAGIAFMPALGELFVAVKGHGATGNGRPLRVSGVKSLADSLVCHGALAQFTDNKLDHMLAPLARATYSQRGHADFDGYRAVLRGQADAMIDPGIAPWDVCAAAVLIREAGGTFSALDGNPTIYGPGAIASNGHVHDELCGLLAARQ
jgi:histidinol phosphatase-like enzyme (inositol monophosphatase family)